MPQPTSENPPPSAHVLDGHGGAHEISAGRPQPDTLPEGVVWVALNYTDPGHRDWLSGAAGLDPLVVDALLAEETRPRATPLGDGLLIALRGVNLNPGADPADMVSIRIWIDARRIVTTRRRDLQSVHELEADLRKGEGPTGAADFLVSLIDRLVWRMGDTVEDLEGQIGAIEERVLDESSQALRTQLADLRRQTIALRRYLAPERDALSRLVGEKAAWLDDASRLRLREISDRLMRHVEDLDALRERAAVTQEEILSRLSEQMGNRMYVLSIVAAIFLPLGFLTGLMGMNVGGIPGTDDPTAFLIFCALLVALVVVQIVIFRWRKWL